MDCLMHVGLHKTGSTSIQYALRNFDDGRSFYAQFGERNHSIPFYTMFSENYLNYYIWKRIGLTDRQIENKRSRYFAQLRRNLLKRRDRIIFSGEDISVLEEDNIFRMKTILKYYGVKNISIILYVRNPLDFAASSFQSLIKGGIINIPNIITQNCQLRIEKFVRVFGRENVIVKSFEPEIFEKSDVVRAFCLDFDLDMNLVEPSRKNESLGAEVIKLIFLFNKTNPLHNGEILLQKSRMELINNLKYIIKDKTKINKLLFLANVDRSDIEYLCREWNIRYDIVDCDKQYDLNCYLNHIDDATVKDLRSYLHRSHIYGKYDGSVTSLVNRLYYYYICKNYARGKYIEKLKNWALR